MRAATLLILCCVFGVGVAPLHAQNGDRSGITWAEIFDADEAWLIGGVAAGTVVLERFDASLTRQVGDSTVFERSRFDPIARGLHLAGRPGSFFLAGGAFALGKAIGEDGMADLGLHTGTALLITEIATRGLKGLIGRARPGTTSGPLDFAFGRGFGDEPYSSFPSGHASSSFATAAVVQGELARRGSPYHLPVAIAMYGAATAIGLGRVYENDHWLTDILAGAALGYLIGENVVEYAHHDDSAPASENAPSSSRAGTSLPRFPVLFVSLPVR